MNPYLRSLARFPMQAAFRYHKQPNEMPALAFEWTRFPDSSVLAAVAERAVVTTLVTTEGRSLTEVRLTIKNQAQPFLKVALPLGASILSAEVAGEKVKPVEDRTAIASHSCARASGPWTPTLSRSFSCTRARRSRKKAAPISPFRKWTCRSISCNGRSFSPNSSR